MHRLLTFIRKGNRRRSLGLITIGLVMLICSQMAESLPYGLARETVQIAVILGGIVATASLFGAKGAGPYDE